MRTMTMWSQRQSRRVRNERAQRPSAPSMLALPMWLSLVVSWWCPCAAAIPRRRYRRKCSNGCSGCAWRACVRGVPVGAHLFWVIGLLVYVHPRGREANFSVA
jgi:hypothetical protein